MKVRRRIEEQIALQLRRARKLAFEVRKQQTGFGIPSANLRTRVCSFCGEPASLDTLLVRGDESTRTRICAGCVYQFAQVLSQCEAAIKTDAAESDALIASLEKSLGGKL